GGATPGNTIALDLGLVGLVTVSVTDPARTLQIAGVVRDGQIVFVPPPPSSEIPFTPPTPSGPPGFVKAGAGTLELDAANTYTRPTTVAAGLLLVDGSQPSSPVVVSGGTLAGHGQAGPTRVLGGGRLVAEDNASGTPTVFRVAGDLHL